MSKYEPTSWNNASPPFVNASNLNKLEAGIESAHTEIEEIVDGTVKVVAIHADSAVTVDYATQTHIGGAKMWVDDTTDIVQGFIDASSPIPPGTIIDFVASTNRVDGILCEWTTPVGSVPMHFDLHTQSGRLLGPITSPYLWAPMGGVPTPETNYTLLVRAVNDEGDRDSNTSVGRMLDAIIPPGPIVNFTASENRADGINCTWTLPVGTDPTFNLQADGGTIAYDVSSPYLWAGSIDIPIPDVNQPYTMAVLATNSEGSSTSNTATGMKTPSNTLPDNIVDMVASNDRSYGIACEWTQPAGQLPMSFEAHNDIGLVNLDVTSPYVWDGTGGDNQPIPAANEEHRMIILARNNLGHSYSNPSIGKRIDSGAPDPVLDFTATDNRNDGILCEWSTPTGGHPTQTQIWRDNLLVNDNATSPHLWDGFGGDYGVPTWNNYYLLHVTTINAEGSANSNRDFGRKIFFVAKETE